MVLLNELGRTIVVGDTVNEPQPPSIGMVLNLFSSYKQYYRGFHENCRLEDVYYFGENQVPVPNDMAIDPVKPPTARSMVNTATDHVDVSNPTILVPDPSPRAKNRSEKIQKALQGIWLNIPELILRTGTRQEINYGISFLKAMWDTSQWPDGPILDDFNSDEEYREALKEYQQARRISFPFIVKNVNPQNMVWDDSRVGMKWAIEFYDTKAEDVRRLYPEWLSMKKDDEAVTFMEYWDKEWMGRIIDNQWVFGPIRHGYGFMPYEAVIPGTSLNWDVGDPAKRYQGLMKPAHNLLDTEARLMTQFQAVLHAFAWPTLDFKGPLAQAENTADAYEMFGAKNRIPPTVEVESSPRPVPPQEIMQQLQIVRSAIEEATFPSVVRGSRPQGISSGFGVTSLAGLGRLVFGPYANGMAQAMQGLNQKFLMLIENIALGSITVRARSDVHDFDQTIGPSDIRGFYENKVTLKAEAPEEREREAILAERLKNSGIISLYEAMRRSGITNPLEEMNQIAAEQLLEIMRPMQAEQLIQQINLPRQLGQAAGAPNSGQFTAGLPQLQRPGEQNIQRGRASSQAGQPSVFPQGAGGVDILGSLLGSPTSPGITNPNGARTR